MEAENEINADELGKLYRGSDLERILATQIKQVGLPIPETEYHFHPERKWRADFAWPEQKVLAEVQGGTWSKGRHTRGRGYRRDCEKLNHAQKEGWEMFWFTGDQVKDGSAIGFLVEYLINPE